MPEARRGPAARSVPGSAVGMVRASRDAAIAVMLVLRAVPGIAWVPRWLVAVALLKAVDRAGIGMIMVAGSAGPPGVNR
jgi:hypothetical protein